MARLFTETFDGGTDGAVVGSSGTAFDYVRNGPTYAPGMVGMAMRCQRTTTGDQYAQVMLGTRTTLYFRAYVRRVTTTVVNDLARVLNASAQVTGVLRVTTTGAVQMRTGSANVGAASTATIPTDDYARIEWAVTPTTMRLRVYSGANKHGSTPDFDSGDVGFTPVASFDRLHTGIVTSVNGVELLVDELAGDDSTWVGAALEPDPDPHPVTRWAWTGTAWAPMRTYPVTRASGPRRIAYVGDSLTRQDVDGSPRVNTSLGTLGWESTHRRVSGHVGRPITGTNGLTTATQTTDYVIGQWQADNWNPQTWVIALGANNIFQSPSGWPAMVNTICDLIAGDAPCTAYWVNQVYRAGSQYDATAPAFNTMLANTLAARTDTGVTWVVVDLHAALRNGRDESNLWAGGSDDGRHMSATGYELRNTLIGSVIAAEAP